jgi:thiamine biosynthesis lipoprotein ApbE
LWLIGLIFLGRQNVLFGLFDKNQKVQSLIFVLNKPHTNMQALNVGLASLISAIPQASASNHAGILSAHFDHILGTSMDLKIIANTFEIAENAEQLVLAEIKRQSNILGSFDTSTEFSQWQKTMNEAVPVSDELHAVLHSFDVWNERTGGVIQAAAEEVNQLWKLAALENKLPSKESLQEVASKANQSHWELGDGTATHVTNAALRLHTFAKSYIMDQASEKAIKEIGVEGLVINIGGDLIVKGNHTEKIALTDPRNSAENAEPLAMVALHNKAVATSGDYRRGVEINGSKYSHVVDPRTALPAEEIISATVIHPDAVTAGALATAFNVLTIAESKALAVSIPGLEFLLMDREGQITTSENWSNQMLSLENKAAKSSISMVNLKEKVWNANQELLINFELATFEGRFRRPFVAVWIEDEDHKPVRRIAIWYNKPRWLPELRSWYSALRTNDIDLASITSATRPAGNYSLVWDGKNDAGQLVNQGKYTVFVEAAREHGTYQLIKQEMNFDGKPKDQVLPGNEEISSASLAYRNK